MNCADLKKWIKVIRLNKWMRKQMWQKIGK